MATLELDDEVRCVVARHPLNVAGLCFYVVGVTAAGVGVGLSVCGVILSNAAMVAAGCLTILAAVVLGFESRALRERAVAAATLELGEIAQSATYHR